MSKSTQRRSVLARTFVLIGAMLAAGAVEKKVFAGERKSQYTSGTGWGGGAVYSPKRVKFKPSYMRDPQYRAKRKTK